MKVNFKSSIVMESNTHTDKKYQDHLMDLDKELSDSLAGIQIIRVSAGTTTLALTDGDGIIRLVSREAEDVFKVPSNLLLGQALDECLSSQLELAELIRFRQLAVTGKDSESALLRIRSGSIVWIDNFSLRSGSFACDFYGFASLRHSPVSSKTLDAILGLDVFSSEYYSFLRYAASFGQPTGTPSRHCHRNMGALSLRRQTSNTSNGELSSLTDSNDSLFCNFQFDDESELNFECSSYSKDAMWRL
eukprot:gene11466-23978_t